MSFQRWVFIHTRVIKIPSLNLGLSQHHFIGLKYGIVFHSFQGPLLPWSESSQAWLSAAGDAKPHAPRCPCHRWPAVPRVLPHPLPAWEVPCSITDGQTDPEKQRGSTKCNAENQIQEFQLPKPLLSTRPWLPPNIVHCWLLFNLSLRLQLSLHSIRTCNCR